MDVIKTWFSLAATFLGASILPAVILLALGIVAIRLAMGIVEKLLQKLNLEKAACGLIKTVLRVVLWGLLALMVAEKLGIDVTGIVALASVLTLAVSLALQNMMANVIGGFTILSTHPFHSGDYVEIAGQSGTVQEISMSYTKLTTPDNKMISIPNSAVVAAQIVNYTVLGKRRLDIKVSASYDSDVQTVLEALREAASVDTILPEHGVFVALSAYGDSAMEYVVRVWCPTDKYWDVYNAALYNVKKVFDREGIKMTYPHLNVHLDK